MKKFNWLACLLSVLSASQAIGINLPALTIEQPLQYPVVVRVYFEQKSQVQAIADQFDVWTINPRQNYAVVQLNDLDSFNALLKQGLPLRLDQKLMQQYDIDLTTMSEAKTQGSGISGFACYSTVSETFQKMEQMNSTYPDLVELIDIGDSWEKIQNGNAGEDLKVIQLTNENVIKDKPILFIGSSIHAREYTTAELNTRFAQFLVSHYGINADVTWILDNHEVHLSLLTNPDGRKQAETGILWRKNTNNNHCPNSNSRGIDLNRNYPFQWAIGGSSSACSDVFYGPSEGSEPEVAAQMDYLRSIYDDNRGTAANDAAPDDTAGIFVDIHSFSQLVLWPWGYTDNITANDNQLQALGKRTAWFNQYRPQPVNELVITGGGSIDAVYGELGVASLAFELGTAFFQDCETFENQILPDNLAALLYLARVTQAPYTQPLGPDIENLSVIPNVIIENTSVQISGTANDNRYNQSNGLQVSEPIDSVKLYINELPINSSNGQNLAALDGSYDAEIEAFVGDVDTQFLFPGKNLIYLQANDGTHDGATFAEFIDVVDVSEVATLNGQITDALTGQAINKARLKINGSQALTSMTGNYQQYVQPSTADLTVTAENYASQTLSGLTLNAGQILQQNIQLQPFCDIFNDDIEGGVNGWSAQSPWAISNELSNSPANAWSDSPGGSYSANSNTTLTSPAIAVSQASSVEINYNSFCDTEAGFDFGLLEAQYDAGVWQTIVQCDGESAWQAVSKTVELPVNTDELKIRFRLTSDGFIETDGWHIDDLSVKASGAICAQFINDIIFANDFE